MHFLSMLFQSNSKLFYKIKEGGNGLGLATCYNIAERHNVQSKVEYSSSGRLFP
ncbi:hypothetical protein SBF1_3720003 [Candidatus Desulfosporosinus infrequens]|uniref:Histidine kinase/HSP90-like ATPase domain-containing protein n=1 Tax=Candidatus Desulfosporosinus infrequens TaxID=2043169 RepID=A0A2U3L4T9_9FIRM|nr:hypothetical protein SBF1_3720003 [Candidatus Desulfosporosinus infrequens]